MQLKRGSAMPKQIEIDDDIFEYLQGEAEPLVDTTSTVLRRLLEIPSGPRRGPQAAALAPDPPSASLIEHSDSASPKAARSRSGGPPGRSRRSNAPVRRPSGDLLAIETYRPAILEFLARQDGGQAPLRDVLAGVGRSLSTELTEADKEEVELGRPYWHNRLPWAGTEARKDGLLATDAPRGIWRLTDKGREQARMIEGSRS